MKGTAWVACVLALALVLTGAMAKAADYPNKPITLQVPYPPGGSTDVGARIVAAIAEKMFGQPVVVMNKGGAGGQLGWTELSKQKPDGYYLGMISMPHMLTAILDPERKSTFKAEDITPIISQALDPTTISVRPDSWKTLKELIDDAKKRPGQISAGIVGYLQDDEIGYLQFAEGAGVQLRLVYFDGAAPAITMEIRASSIKSESASSTIAKWSGRSTNDIPLLVQHFLQKYGEENGKPGLELAPDALDLLMDYEWPGNVRELENVIERAAVLNQGSRIGTAMIPDQVRRSPTFQITHITVPPDGLSLKDVVTNFEKRLIESRLESAGGVQKRAAELLRIKPTTLNEMIKRYDIAPRRKRNGESSETDQ